MTGVNLDKIEIVMETLGPRGHFYGYTYDGKYVVNMCGSGEMPDAI